MEWIEALRGSIVALDTAPLVYFIEEHPAYLQSPGLTTVPLDESIAEAAAGLRARHNLRTPDAIQLATASSAGASWFLTNDTDLARVLGVSVLVLTQLP